MKNRYLLFIFLAVSIAFTGMLLAAPAESSGLTVTFPNGGEKLPIGSTQTITWEGYEAHAMKIYLSIDSGNNYDIHIGSGSGGSFMWTVPDISTDRARIKVTGQIQYFTHFHQPYTVEDASDADFSIGRLPAAPTDLKAAALSDSEIRLTWTDNADNETGFAIERNQHEIATVGADVESAVQSGLPASTLYSYRVRAFNAFGYSEYSNTVRVSTLPKQPTLLPPAAPSNLKAVVLSDSEILLTWTDNADNETAFWLERVKETEPGVGVHPIDFKHWVLLGEDIETFTDSGLDARSTYTYKVRAFNDAGYSDYSNEARATTFPPDFVSPVPTPTVPKIVMRLGIGSTKYYVDDLPEIMDTAPVILEGRTLLPIRYVAEPLGAVVRWDPGEQKATVLLKMRQGSGALDDLPPVEEEELEQARVVELWIGQNRARVNGVYQSIDPANHNVTPLIVPPGRTMLPLRFIAEALGCQVDWNGVTQEVTVTYTAP